MNQVARSISGDIYLIAISIGIFVVLAVTFLTRCCAGSFVHRRKHYTTRTLAPSCAFAPRGLGLHFSQVLAISSVHAVQPRRGMT